MKTPKRPRFFGLTGGIGTGKSSVAKEFLKQGVPCVDADQVARRIREPGKPGHAAILKRFGTDDPQKLRDLLTADTGAKKDLEAILHPLIREQSELALQEMARTHPHAPFILYEASLLIEAGRKEDFEALIVVTAPLEDRITRIMSRDKNTREAAIRMIEAQNSEDFRLKHAHYVVLNHGSLQDLEGEVRKVLDQIISS